MGQALVRGLVVAGVYSPREIVTTDVNKNRLSAFAEEMGTSSAGNVEAVSQSSTIILAVKPVVVEDVLEEIADYLKPDHLVISIAAGVKTQQIESKLRSGIPVVRAMPNTPVMVSAGASAICRGKNAGDNNMDHAHTIFGAVGTVIEVPEGLMDAVTGLSGSGPAYVYIMIEALSDAGVRAGLTRQKASLLAAQTVFGAAKMVIDTGRHPAELKDEVTSPGGSTIAGIAALERAAFRAAIFDAVEAAVERSKELA
jgi:pyrroline-5-carboxylate reductase